VIKVPVSTRAVLLELL